ncbi:MAG TPA: iron-containing alcohol dehydrogenase, partial [Gaiellaceae bacterium]
MIVRWGLDALPEVCAEAGVSSALLVASPRWDLPIDARARWSEVPSHRVDEAAAQAGGGVIAVGGGSAIDLGKAISAVAGVPLVSVPTTYAGAEWTTYYGVRDPERKLRGGGAGAHPAGIVYDVDLTLQLPREPTVGTAMNALAHCAEALYVRGHNGLADAHAVAGAALIATSLPRVVADPNDREARTELLRAASHGGAALAGSGLALAHAMA